MGNKFYDTIKKRYDDIFPLNNMQVDFVKSEFDNTDARLIEIGCANGKLTNALNMYDIRGIDLEESFISIAENRYPNIKFEALNMLEIDTLDETFDGIICFGNTLVHLKIDEIEEFIIKCYASLVEGGKLMIQILNYDNILDNNITELPVIDNDMIKFVRTYKLGDRIEFITDLHVKESDEVISNSIYLTPIRKDELKDMLTGAGFKDIEFFSSFKKTAIQSDSLPCVVRCVK